MNQLSGFISLHPYFKVPPDKMPHLKRFCRSLQPRRGTKRVISSTSSRSTATKYSAAKATSTPKRCWRTWKTWVQCSHRRWWWPTWFASKLRTSRRARETERAAGPSETRLVRIAQL